MKYTKKKETPIQKKANAKRTKSSSLTDNRQSSLLQRKLFEENNNSDQKYIQRKEDETYQRVEEMPDMDEELEDEAG